MAKSPASQLRSIFSKIGIQGFGYGFSLVLAFTWGKVRGRGSFQPFCGLWECLSSIFTITKVRTSAPIWRLFDSTLKIEKFVSARVLRLNFRLDFG